MANMRFQQEPKEVVTARAARDKARPPKPRKPKTRAPRRVKRANGNDAGAGSSDDDGDGGSSDPEPAPSDFRPTWRLRQKFDADQDAANPHYNLISEFEKSKHTAREGAAALVKRAQQAGLDIRVGPVSPSTGKPNVKLANWTSDPETLENWTWDGKAVGVALGEQRGLVAVRVENDAKPPELPTTFTVTDAGGARWHWYTVPEGVEAIYGFEIAPNAVLLGNGDFALADPYECFEGKQSAGWSAIAEDIPLAELPARIANKAGKRTGRSLALEYIRAGLEVVSLWPGPGSASKTPKTEKVNGKKSWAHLVAKTPEDVGKRFDTGGVGGALGRNGFTDVDCDCPEAVAMARRYLPPTDMVWGRDSSPCSHWGYRTDLSKSDKALLKYDDPRHKGEEAHLGELRIGGPDKAMQSVLPGSVHPSGEVVRWEPGKHCNPAAIDGAALKRCVGKVFAGALLVKAWPDKGSRTRHDSALALSGFLRRCAGWDVSEISDFIGAVASDAGDEEWRDRVRTATEKDGKELPGRIELANAFGKEVAARLQEWLCASDSEAKDVLDHPWLREAQEKHAIVMIGGKVRITDWKEVDLYDGEGGQHLVLDPITEHDFLTFNKHRYVVRTSKTGREHKVRLAEEFMESPNTRRYRNVVYAPGKQVSENSFNMARGFAIQPKPGDWSLMRSHIYDVIAAGNKEHAEYILNWIAWMFRNPGSPAEVALVFRGGKGIGKGMLGNALWKILQPHSLRISNREHLLGKFNFHLMYCTFLLINEGFWPGDKAGEGVFKDVTTELTLTVEPKGLGVFQARNSLHCMILGNDEWLVPASADERRYAVFEVSPHRRGDVAYFEALADEQERGGLAAMAHDLSSTEAKHPRYGVPQTEALHDQKQLSMPPADALVQELIEGGALPDGDPLHPDTVPTTTEGGLWSFARTILGRRCPSPVSLAKFLRNEWGFADGRYAIKALHGREFVKAYRVPPLWKLREMFERKYPGVKWMCPTQREWGELMEETAARENQNVEALPRERKKKAR